MNLNIEAVTITSFSWVLLGFKIKNQCLPWNCPKYILNVLQGSCMVISWHVKDVSKMFQWCFNDVSRMFQGCFNDVSMMFQWCFKDVSQMFRESFKGGPKLPVGDYVYILVSKTGHQNTYWQQIWNRPLVSQE